MKEITQNSAKHSIGFHLIWCTKYRNQVLRGAAEVECKKILAETCKANK
jgi:REP element-mobilizing transposase RayT